jgi:hypothetical protein
MEKAYVYCPVRTEYLNMYIINHFHAQQNLQKCLQVTSFGLSIKPSSDLLNIQNYTKTCLRLQQLIKLPAIDSKT